MAIGLPIVVIGPKTKIISGIILAFFATLFGANLIYALATNINIHKDYQRIEAVVERVEYYIDEWTDSDGNKKQKQKYEVFVDYQVGEVFYDNIQVNVTNGSRLKQGDTLKIYYNINDPYSIRSQGANFASTGVFAAFTLITGSISIYCFVGYFSYLHSKKTYDEVQLKNKQYLEQNKTKMK